MSQAQTELGQVLKVFRMWESSFRIYVVRCGVRAFGYGMLAILVVLALTFMMTSIDWTKIFVYELLPIFFVSIILSVWLNLTDRIVVHEGGVEIYIS